MDLASLPDYMKDPNAVLLDDAEWIHGTAPDYSAVNELYEREKTKSHPVGSLEDLVSNLVKNWEREASHKTSFQSCRTMDASKFWFATNGTSFTGDKLSELGTYNALIGECEHYSSSRVPSSEESHHIFRSALKSGFAWECLQVYSGPPTLAFKWRHWGVLEGEMKCPMRNGQDLLLQPEGNKPVEVFGVSIAHLNPHFQLTGLETFWNPDSFFQQIVDA